MSKSLYDFLPPAGASGGDELLGRFLDCVAARKLERYPAQEAAILELFEGRNVILNTPTGPGKSLVTPVPPWPTATCTCASFNKEPRGAG